MGASRLTGAGRNDDARAFTQALGAMKGPDDESRAIARDDSRGAAGGLCGTVDEPASQAPAMGAAFVRPAHAGGTRRGLAALASRNSTSPRPPPLRSAKSTAP